MDIARVATDLDLAVAKLQDLHRQVETALLTLAPSLDAEMQRRLLEDLKGKLSRAKLTTMQSRDAARQLAPKSYQTEHAGL